MSERAKVSKKNKYYLEKHRFYELKHFCRQYGYWKKMFESLDSLAKNPDKLMPLSRSRHIVDPVATCVEEREYYATRMDMVENAAKETDPTIGKYIFKAVTEGLSYDALFAFDVVPCCKDTYYKLYRIFFWILDKKRK